ncbi:MAG: hypothetical protein ACKOX6_16690 [Bdellovibrio sp.]
MKIFVVIMLLCGSSLAHATKACRSSDDKAELILTIRGNNVVALLQTEPVDYNQYHKEKVDADVMAQEQVRFEIRNTDVSTVLGQKKMLVTLVTSAIFQLNQFEGDEDMASVYAEQYVTKLLCQ